jgi:glycosyltransferase involved in cell wall biosynthesis
MVKNFLKYLSVILTPLEYGGGERQVLQLVDAFIKNGTEVLLINLAQSQAFEEEAARRNIPFLRITSTRLGFSPTIFSYCLHLIKILPTIFFNRHLKEEILKADILWARGFPANAFLVAAKFIYRPKAKLIYSHHWEKRPTHPIMRWLQLKILERFDVIVGVSSSVAKTLKQVFPELAPKIIAIPNGIDIKKFKIQNSKFKIREELNLSSEAVIAVYVARFTPQKNHMFLLEVLKKVELPSFRLLLLGDGTELEAFLSKAREENLIDRIIHKGFVKPDEVSKYLAASDFCVFPSLGEGFSNAILEAMAAGLPVIMFKRIWSEEYGKNVIVAETEEEFIEAVKKLINDSNLASELGRRCHEDVQALDIKNIANRYLSLFRDVAGQFRPNVDSNL